MTCGDYNVFNTEDIGGKLKPKERKEALKCKNKIVLHSSIKKKIEAIPYPDYKLREVVNPEETEDSKKNDNSKANNKKEECMDDNVLNHFDDLKNGIKKKGKNCIWKKPEDKKKKKDILRERRLMKEMEAEYALPLSPHPKDEKIYWKIKRLQKNQQRKLLQIRASRRAEHVRTLGQMSGQKPYAFLAKIPTR
jgi:hypothetical protein